ncbi:hypothetical protein P3342_004797 [Pyrenophora teres f. teres]|nr:hypothetical protein P3342_004797 [Pyrenophora teres f. teres]
MDFRCKRCEEKKLRCFVETSSGRCAGCISVGAECSLFVPEEEWRIVQEEREEKELSVARLKAQRAQLDAQLSQQELELLEVRKRERSFARRDLAILAVQDRAKEQVEGNSAPGTDLPAVEPSLSGSPADMGWLQAELDFLDPSFDLSFLLGIRSPLRRMLLVVLLYQFLAVLNLFDLVLVVLEFDVRRQLGIWWCWF